MSLPSPPRSTARPADADSPLLYQVMRALPAAAAVATGADQRLTFFNARFQVYAAGRAQLGQTLAQCFPEVVEQGFTALVDQVYRTGRALVHEDLPLDVLDPVTHRREAAHYHITLEPLRGASGRVEGVLVFGIDTTAQVRARAAAEQARAAQQEFYETLLRETPAGIVAFDAKHRYLWTNLPAAQHGRFDPSMLGLTSAQACAARGYTPALAAERDRRFAQALRERREVTWEETVPGPAGAEQWLRRMRPVFGPDGELELMVASGLDATEHRRAEARMRAQQALVQQVLDAVPNPIWVTDAGGQALLTNAAQAAVRQQVAAQRRHHPPLPGPAAAAAQVLALRDHVHRTGEEVAAELAFDLGPDGPRDYQVVMRPLSQPDGSLLVLTVGTDVTALKQAQRAATAAAQAQESFLATMSHEIRTPLNGVLGMAGLLAKTALEPEQRRYLNVVHHSGHHLLAILNDVLDMAKIRAGQLQLETVVVDLNHVLQSAGQTLAWQAQEKALALTTEGVGLGSSPVYTDPVRLNQVLLNLLGNAIKFTETGQVRLQATVHSETAEELTVHFEVYDTGPGLSPEAQEHIFDAFAQASADTTRRYGGTGLGLAISSRLVHQLGGHLVVCSEPGQGSTFGFSLSLRKAPAGAAVDPVPSGIGSGAMRGWQVLLVDDNALNLELATAVLTQNGVAVHACETGAAALALFDQHRYHAVLMDVHMPGMGGLEATGRIRQHPDPVRAATPVVALTADAFRAQHESYRAAGMSDVLAKPFTEAELLNKLGAVCTGFWPADDAAVR